MSIEVEPIRESRRGDRNETKLVINVPHGINVGKVDLAVELQILSYHEQRKLNAGKPGLRAVGDRGGGATA